LGSEELFKLIYTLLLRYFAAEIALHSCSQI